MGRRGKVFHALANPSEVRLYDWVEYVLEEFGRCSDRVQQQVTSRCSKILLSGCLLFLQVDLCLFVPAIPTRIELVLMKFM